MRVLVLFAHPVETSFRRQELPLPALEARARAAYAVFAEDEADAGQEYLVDEPLRIAGNQCPDREREQDRFGGKQPLDVGGAMPSNIKRLGIVCTDGGGRLSTFQHHGDPPRRSS